MIATIRHRPAFDKGGITCALKKGNISRMTLTLMRISKKISKFIAIKT